MDKRLKALKKREVELQGEEQNILNLLKVVREEMHKMQVEQLQWESMDMPVTEIYATEESTELDLQSKLMNESEVNAQVVNLEVPKVNELFMRRNKKLRLNDDEEEEEEESDEADEPDTENENSDDDLFSML